MQLINQVIAFNVDAVCVCVCVGVCLLHRPTSSRGSNELRRFAQICADVFLLLIWIVAMENAPVCELSCIELMSYRQHSSISSHNRKCAIRRHFEIYVRCGLHSIPSIACTLNRRGCATIQRASACCMEICYLWPHLSDQHVSTAWQTPPFSIQRDEKQPQRIYETILLCICSMLLHEIKGMERNERKEGSALHTEVKMKCV